MRAVLVWAALFALILEGVWDSRTSVPLKPASLPQIHHPPAQQQADRSKSSEAETTKQNGAFLPQTAEAIRPNSQRQSSDGLTGSNRNEEPASSDSSSVFWSGIKFTDVITLSAAVVGVVIAGLQLVTYRRQAKIMGDQLVAARIAADAAKDSVDLTRTLTGAQQRAYILVAGFHLASYKHAPGSGPADSWIPYVVFRNAGSTPAERVVTGIFLYFGDQRDVPSGFISRDDIRKQYWPDIGNGQTQSVGFGGLPISLWGDVKTGKSHYFLFGCLEYDDIFDNITRRRTEFCYAIRPLGDLSSSECAIATQVTDIHNGRDDQCMFQPKPWSPPGTELSIRMTKPDGSPMWPRNAV